MRGDRPAECASCPRYVRATPHARGSTHPCCTRRRRTRGYPACAGIDLRMVHDADLRSRLPRMRGDRPTAGHGAGGPQQATPHARGSTSTTIRDNLPWDGYPACAGIDPVPVRAEPGTPGLPRMRGDRPLHARPFQPQLKATPHARGSTPACPPVPAPTQGYPACAGIDLAIHSQQATRPGLPRMRGDRPRDSLAAGHPAWATPHARGSTRQEQGAAPSRTGYPACAGIDRGRERGQAADQRLPRMRGDRPPSNLNPNGRLVATPHARGSTLLTPETDAVAGGYPACAGIDPDS